VPICPEGHSDVTLAVRSLEDPDEPPANQLGLRLNFTTSLRLGPGTDRFPDQAHGLVPGVIDEKPAARIPLTLAREGAPLPREGRGPSGPLLRLRE
jgi:hypothetical protein